MSLERNTKYELLAIIISVQTYILGTLHKLDSVGNKEVTRKHKLKLFTTEKNCFKLLGM